MDSEDQELDQVTLYPEWKQAAIDAKDEFDYGDTITHEWLYEHFDIQPPAHGTVETFKKFNFQFLAYVESFKAAMLEDYKMFLNNIPGVGWEIVLPEHQTSISWEKMTVRLGKELNRTSARITNIKRDDLSDAARLENSLKQATLAALRSMTKNLLESEESTGDDEDGTV